MISKLNLASRPFTNRALPWVVTSVIVFFSLFALLLIARATANSNAQAATLKKDTDELRKQENLIRKAADAVKNSLTLEQQKTLKAAHELVDRKRFSWTRLFGDLEAVLPNSVKVTRIAVREVHTYGGRTVADLELSILAESSNSVTDMINEMDKKGIFHADLKTVTLQKGRGEKGSEYELNLEYSPATSYPIEETTRSSSDSRVAVSAGGGR